MRALTADGDFHSRRDGHISVQVWWQGDVAARFVQMDQIRAVARYHPVVQLIIVHMQKKKRIK